MYETEAVAWRYSVKKVFLKNLQKPTTFLKKRLWHRCFSVIFGKFLRTAFFIEHLRGLLLMKIEIRDGAYTKKNEIKAFELFERNIAWIKA